VTNKKVKIWKIPPFMSKMVLVTLQCHVIFLKKVFT